MKYALPIVIIVLALLGANGIYVVGQGHAAAVLRLGSVQATAMGPGLHFKLPFAQTIVVYDTRSIISQAAPAECKTRDGRTMRIGFHVRWQVLDSDVYFKATAGDELKATQQMMPLARAALCKQVAQHDLAGVLAATDGALAIPARAAIRAEVRQKLGIAVLGVSVGRVVPPDDALAAVYKRMDADAKAQVDVVRADGNAAAAAIRAKGSIEDDQLLAAANQSAAAVRGRGEAEAAKIYAQAATQDPQFFQYWSTLDTWRKSFSAGGAVVVLDKGSPLMQAVDAGAAAASGAAKKH
jgi:membrane protease subunit HflC